MPEHGAREALAIGPLLRLCLLALGVGPAARGLTRPGAHLYMALALLRIADGERVIVEPFHVYKDAAAACVGLGDLEPGENRGVC